MSRPVLSILSDSTVRRAVKTMVERGVGGVVVLDSEGPQGVFTERDLLSKVLCRGKDPDRVVIAEVASPVFAAVRSDATLEEAARVMVEKNGPLMVFEDNDLVGVVTTTDIVGCVSRVAREVDLDGVITKKLVCELPQTPLDIVIHDMDARHVGSVLVAEEEVPYGIFTQRDLLTRVISKGVRLKKPVGDVTSVPLITASIGIGGVEAARIMVSKRIKRLPLTLQNEVSGMVTARDVVEAFSRSA